jgi:hypothetical protein
MKQFIKKPWVQWSALFLFILVILYFVYKPEVNAFFFKRKGKDDGTNKLAVNQFTGQTDPTIAAAMSISVNKQLRRGDKGDEVIILQQLINETGYKPRLSEDGKFGNLTLNAVRSLMGAPRATVSISDFIAWRTKSLLPTGGVISANTGINPYSAPGWWLSILTP